MNKSHLTIFWKLSLIATLAAVGSARAQNLVGNPGFETGNISSWTFTPAPSGSDFAIAGGSQHTGFYGAFFGAGIQGDYDTISQGLNTVGGNYFDVSFWLTDDSVPANNFVATFGGQTLLNIAPNPFPYTQFTFTDVPGTGATTTLSFAAYNVGGGFRLDDVSVTPSATPEPSTVAILLGSIGMLFGTRRFGRRHSGIAP